ncbi:YidB family protein [Rhizobium sp. NXC24]|uniref:YidB family protein n=1 Tax=Rhizobium sp. NXC24 TaxID=2048897 RepID=UPI0032AF5725
MRSFWQQFGRRHSERRSRKPAGAVSTQRSGDTAESWVSTGDNKPINGQELSQALGHDILSELAAKTGLSRQEILSRLSRDLPKAVNELTPNGSVPTEKQADAWTSA